MKKPKIFYGWWIVVAVFLISAYANGIVSYSFTAIIEPIVNKFGWSYSQVSFAASIRGIEATFLAPLVGIVIDRFGPRKLIFAGGVIIGFGLLALSRINSIMALYGSFILMATGMSTCGGLLLSTVVGHWFRKNLSLAIGIVVSGGAFGGLMVPLVTRLIDTISWQTALLALGLAAWCVILPLSLVVRHKPEQYGYLPDGERLYDEDVLKPVTAEKVAPTGGKDMKISQVLKSRAFWQISLAVMCHLYVANAVNTHIMPYLSSISISRTTSSLMVSAMTLVSILGRLSFGWFGDKFDRKRVMAAGFMLLLLGVCLLVYVDKGLWLFAPMVIFYGLGWGGVVPLIPAILLRYFTRKRLGTILGLCIGVTMLGSIIGPPLTGLIFDRYGSYLSAWYICIALLIVGLISLVTTPEAHENPKTYYR